MEKPFEPELYHDEYQMRLKELIDAKIEAQDVVIGNEESPQLPLMEALRKTILEAKSKRSKSGKAKEKGTSKDTAAVSTAPYDSTK